MEFSYHLSEEMDKTAPSPGDDTPTNQPTNKQTNKQIAM